MYESQKKIHNIMQQISILLFVIVLIRSLYPMNKTQKYLYNYILIYSFVCCYRAIFLTDENENLCLYKTNLCNPLINRTLATIAEISFAIYIVYALSNIFDVEIPKYLVLIIVIAQVFCWLGVTTNKSIYNMIEESLWALFASINLVYILNSKVERNMKINTIIFGFITYILYLVIIDIPYYNPNKLKIENKNNIYTCNYTKYKDYYKWSYSLIWQLFYYTGGVSYSIMTFNMLK